MRYFRRMSALILGFLLLLTVPVCHAEEAVELTRLCMFSSSDSPKKTAGLTDQSYLTRITLSENGFAQIDLPAGKACGGLYVNFYGLPAPYQVQKLDASGRWETLARPDPNIVNMWIPLPPTMGTLRITANGETCISELRVLGVGELPGWVQTWRYFQGKADLMVVVAHPDDELVFLGGTLPYYCGQLGKHTMVVYMTTGYPRRRNELLDGLWTCGVRDYPELCDYQDGYTHLITYAFERWGGRPAVYDQVTSLVRRYRPDVLVTMDIRNGEDKHGMHRAAADSAVNAVQLAADPGYQTPLTAVYPPWQVQKVYLHLYNQNRIIMPWDQLTLSAFHGQTAADVAKDAFRKHVSQQHTRHKVYLCNPYDSKDFGLFFSTVGEDQLKNDFFEHIPTPPAESILPEAVPLAVR